MLYLDAILDAEELIKCIVKKEKVSAHLFILQWRRQKVKNTIALSPNGNYSPDYFTNNY